jgi:hypothetical protein
VFESSNLSAFAIGILFLVSIAVLSAGLPGVLRQLVFVRRARRVEGRVVSEQCYRMFGRTRRYYRVEVELSTGQRVQLRGTVTSSPETSPALGQAVPVLLIERTGRQAKAKIGTWLELWFSSALLLFIGSIGFLAVALASASSV